MMEELLHILELAFLVIFIIAKIGYSGSLVFYDSMLGDVTTPELKKK